MRAHRDRPPSPVGDGDRGGRIGARSREAALWLGAGLGVLALLTAVVVTCFGFSFLVFRSGSMSPQIPTGALALAHRVPAAAIRPGDVVSVPTASGQRVTHRVVSVTLRGSTTSLVLKGDANTAPDAEIYQVTGADRVVASVPYGGYVAAHVLTPPGLVALGALALMLVLLGHDSDGRIDRGARNARGGSATHRRPRRARVGVGRILARSAPSSVAGAAVVLGLVLGLGHVTGTWASFTDSASVRTGTFTAASLAAPTGVACTGTGASTAVTWTAPAGPNSTSYSVAWSWSNGLLGSGSGTDAVAAGTTRWRPAPAGLLLSRVYTVTVTAVQGSWSSTAVASSNRISVTPSGTYSCTS